MQREPDGGTRARTAAHYAALADHYDTNWTHSESFLSWMADEIVSVLGLGPADRLADVGSGTGLFARRIAASGQVALPVVCIDPSAAMLAQIPVGPELLPVEASAERLAGLDGALVPEPAGGPFDAILVKEAIHHVAPADRRRVLAGLADRLTHEGRLLVVMLPTRIDYPLFDAALSLFTALQPDPEAIARGMRDAGLEVSLTYHQTELRIPRERYLAMVADRYMSLLSEFDDPTLAAGVDEIVAAHPEDVYAFPDRFAFVLGTRTEQRPRFSSPSAPHSPPRSPSCSAPASAGSSPARCVPTSKPASGGATTSPGDAGRSERCEETG